VARGEVLGDAAQDLPLLRVGVLRLVDEHVVDAAIELVEHPGRVAPVEKLQGLVDEVLEVEGPEAHLRLLDAGVDLGRQGEERLRALHGAGGLAPVHETPQPLLFAQEPFLEALPHILRQEGRSLAGRFFLREEGGEIERELLLMAVRPGRRQEGFGALPVGPLAGQKLLRHGGPVLGLDPAFEHGALDALGGFVFAQAELPAKPRGAVGIVQERLAAQRRIERRGERLAHRIDADDVEGVLESWKAAARRVRHDVFGGLHQHLVGLALVQHRKARRHVGLEGHEVQEPLAEGVDGIDLEPARRLHRAGEQGAGEPHLPAGRPLAFELREFPDEALLVEGHPAAQAFEHADRHVGGGRLGEGEAQDAAGQGARQQQAHHPVGEHLGLARARIGRHPGRGARIGGAALRLPGVIGDDEIVAHSAPSPPPALARDHSFTRARWSYSEKRRAYFGKGRDT
jgi:hypothetical protein